MYSKKYIVRLSEDERNHLISITKTGKHAAAKIIHARILLAADIGEYSSDKKTDPEVAKFLDVGEKTVQRVRQRLVEEGLEAALGRKKRVVKEPIIIGGEEEAYLIATCCSAAPMGRVSWTLKLLANNMIEKKIVETVSPSMVGIALKKTNLSLGKKRNGAPRKS
jgi:transposase